MITIRFLLLALLLASGMAAAPARGVTGSVTAVEPDTVVVRSGSLHLRGLLWRPQGKGPFPAVLFNHGSGRGRDVPSARFDEQNRAKQPGIVGPVFARHGYAFLFLFRRGTVLSSGQGAYSGDVMERESALHGEDGRNRIQVALLETDELSDALAGIAFLRSLHEVDARRVAVVGYSFGGSLALITAEHDTTLAAIVDVAGSAGSWPKSPPLRERLRAAVRRMTAPVFFIHAANDYSVAPGKELSAEMARRGRPHRLKIYPSEGATSDEGHYFIFSNVAAWEPDVFAFLDEHLGR